MKTNGLNADFIVYDECCNNWMNEETKEKLKKLYEDMLIIGTGKVIFTNSENEIIIKNVED